MIILMAWFISVHILSLLWMKLRFSESVWCNSFMVDFSLNTNSVCRFADYFRRFSNSGWSSFSIIELISRIYFRLLSISVSWEWMRCLNLMAFLRLISLESLFSLSLSLLLLWLLILWDFKLSLCSVVAIKMQSWWCSSG